MTVMFPVRTVGPGLAATEKLTEPLPAPLAGGVTVIQLGRLAVSTAHVQEGGAPTKKLPLLPAASAVPEVGLIEYVQITALTMFNVMGIEAGELEAAAEVKVIAPL